MIVITATITIDARSDIGAAQRAPFIPMKWGKISVNGINIKTSRIKDEIIALTGLPTAWKKIEETLTTIVNVTNIRRILKGGKKKAHWL